MITTTPTAAETRARAATRATYAAFLWSGVATSSWASRIPQIRDALHLSPSKLGLVLLSIAAGSIVALVGSGHIVARFGSRKTVAAMAALLTVALAGAASGYHFGVAPVVLSLLLFGFANGAWDVAMNVQGAVVERAVGRSIMARFHAGFSIGTVAGALLGALMVTAHVPVTLHLALTAMVVGVSTIYAVRNFMPDGAAESAPDEGGGLRHTLRFWREPRTLLVGVFVLAFALAEGTGIDWISISMIDGYRTSAAVGTLAFAVFLAAMTAGRWFGPDLLDRYGRVPVLRALAVITVAGLALFIFGPNVLTAFLGALLWGLGTSLGFPVGMSAASDDPRFAAPRVSVVASIGYCAFLGGPPLIGFLGDHFTVVKSLVAVTVLVALAAMIANAIKPLPATATSEDPAGVKG
ncbi:MFS transporter [Dactylosporangium matsuzakiense]|uniref:MFS transporter n=1 Tax=Dactylosporangium matsuzakiense TaxID=53360 RepID=A0A9W6KBX2_9ACTN|nr:MFS transporter [Dactylosporangium matsuzakiense]UWZ45350.1 MFS transporter [Dactylosporangium matsuzakiense]GLK98672.1 MFS transporter [Dactylosporangium matsuzakiense]